MSMCCWVISPILFFFAVLDVSLVYKLQFFKHLYLQFYYISESLQQNCAFLDCFHESFVLTGLDHANQFYVCFLLKLKFSVWFHLVDQSGYPSVFIYIFIHHNMIERTEQKVQQKSTKKENNNNNGRSYTNLHITFSHDRFLQQTSYYVSQKE